MEMVAIRDTGGLLPVFYVSQIATKYHPDRRHPWHPGTRGYLRLVYIWVLSSCV